MHTSFKTKTINKRCAVAAPFVFSIILHHNFEWRMKPIIIHFSIELEK